VVTIAEVTRTPAGQPIAKVVEHVWWTGKGQLWQLERLEALCRRWEVARVAVDASGIGAGIASFLAERMGERVEKVVFTAPAKSALGFQMLTMTNAGRLALYRADGSPEWEECWLEICACRYKLREREQIAWSVPESEGHDDFVVSLALCAHAAERMIPPPVSGLIRARPEWESRW
jgi:pimeloyl-ACP methyl ester carboxylesterase